MKRAAVVCALVVGFFPARLPAHEMGPTRVNAVFHRQGTYRIEIVVDPEALLDRLTLLSTGKRSTPLPPDQLRQRIESQGAVFLQQIDVQFDGTRATPTFRYVPAENASTGAGPAALVGVIRLEGSIPEKARTFRFRYAIPYTRYLLTINDEAAPGVVGHQWLDGEAFSRPFSLGRRSVPQTKVQTALLYLRLGFTHIIPKGLDHILFVLGIFLLSTRWRSLLTQVTAFTIAHSVTLALTIYEVVRLPSKIVEPVIALSIAYVGLENVMTRTVRPWRIALVFAFGLLHGMGFAGVLHELGLPRSQFGTALVAFNAGIELGQLAVIGLVFLLIASWARKARWYRQRVIVPLSILIALAGLYWTIERSAW